MELDLLGNVTDIDEKHVIRFGASRWRAPAIPGFSRPRPRQVPEEERMQRKLRSLELRVPPEVPRRETWTAASVVYLSLSMSRCAVISAFLNHSVKQF